MFKIINRFWGGETWGQRTPPWFTVWGSRLCCVDRALPVLFTPRAPPEYTAAVRPQGRSWTNTRNEITTQAWRTETHPHRPPPGSPLHHQTAPCLRCDIKLQSMTSFSRNSSPRLQLNHTLSTRSGHSRLQTAHRGWSSSWELVLNRRFPWQELGPQQKKKKDEILCSQLVKKKSNFCKFCPERKKEEKFKKY